MAQKWAAQRKGCIWSRKTSSHLKRNVLRSLISLCRQNSPPPGYFPTHKKKTERSASPSLLSAARSNQGWPLAPEDHPQRGGWRSCALDVSIHLGWTEMRKVSLQNYPLWELCDVYFKMAAPPTELPFLPFSCFPVSVRSHRSFNRLTQRNQPTYLIPYRLFVCSH